MKRETLTLETFKDTQYFEGLWHAWKTDIHVNKTYKEHDQAQWEVGQVLNASPAKYPLFSAMVTVGHHLNKESKYVSIQNHLGLWGAGIGNMQLSGLVHFHKSDDPHAGKWLHHHTQKQWPAYFNFAKPSVNIHLATSQYSVHHVTHIQHTLSLAHFDPDSASTIMYVLSTCTPTTIKAYSPTCDIPCFIPAIPTLFTTHCLTPTFRQFLQQDNPAYTALLQNITFHNLGMLFGYAHSNPSFHTLYNACNGGARHASGSFGWTIGSNTHTLIDNMGPATGAPMHSFRTKAKAVLSLLHFYQRLIEFYALNKHPTTMLSIHTDSKSLINRLSMLCQYGQKDWYPSVYTGNNMDILTAIIQHMTTLVPTIQFIHVKGHQDTQTQYTDLPRAAQLNVDADHLATEVLNAQDPSHPLPFHPLPECKFYLRHRSKYICSKELQLLQTILPAKQAQAYYVHRYGWDNMELSSIDWTAFRAARKQTPNLTHFTTHLACGWLPANCRLAKLEGTTPKCSMCQYHKSFEHIYQCTHHSDWQSAFLLKMQSHLETVHHNMPSLKVTMLSHFRELLVLPPFPEAQVSANTRQSVLRLTMRGFIPASWGDQQRHYSQATPTLPTRSDSHK